MPTATTLAAADTRPTLAYLGPELPALSATFIYEELLALERRGFAVRAYTVRRPAQPAAGQEALAARTTVLYDRAAPAAAIAGLLALPGFGGRALKALGWLVHDMAAVGLHRRIAWKLVYQWLTGARLARALLRSGCSHLHVHFAHTPAQIAMYASAFSGVPFTITAHANDIFERGLLLPEKAQRAARLLTISHYNLEHLRSLGIARERLAVVRCGVSFAARAEPAGGRAPRTRLRIGTLGRLIEKKGFDDLLRALALLREIAPPVELSIAGDGPLRAPLEALVRELGLAGQVEFTGALAHTAVSSWLHGLDVFALACKRDANGDMDGIPVALMEAMSQRVPVVSTRLSGIPELVVDERSGLLAAPADPKDLARQLQRLLTDAALRERHGAAGAAHVEAEFGQQVNLDRLLGYFGPSKTPRARPARLTTP